MLSSDKCSLEPQYRWELSALLIDEAHTDLSHPPKPSWFPFWYYNGRGIWYFGITMGLNIISVPPSLV